MKLNVNISLIEGLYYNHVEYEPGTVFLADYIDDDGFASIGSIGLGLGVNEYEIFTQELENK